MDKSLLSGSTSLLLLQLLSQKDMYGYEMMETLSRCTDQVFALPTGTLYPLLHALERDGSVESYESTESAKARRYYTLTSKGRQVLAEKRTDWCIYCKAVNGLLEGGQ